MKNYVWLLAVGLALASCGAGTKNEGGQPRVENEAVSGGGEAAVEDYVEVLYFHGKQRCATCLAIEKQAQEAVQTAFAEPLKQGRVVFRIVDISKEENEALAEKYEVTWSSLFVVRHRAGKETAEDLTKFAFANARKSPDEFRAGVVKAVNDKLE